MLVAALVVLSLRRGRRRHQELLRLELLKLLLTILVALVVVLDERLRGEAEDARICRLLYSGLHRPVRLFALRGVASLAATFVHTVR